VNTPIRVSLTTRALKHPGDMSQASPWPNEISIHLRLKFFEENIS
jgi:hypothetical protein